MKSPWQIRFDTAMATVREFLKHTGKSVDVPDIERIEAEIFNTFEIAPSTDDFRIYPFEEGFDFDRFLAYLYSLKNDADFIENSLYYLEKISKNIDISIQLEKASLKSTERIGNKYVALLSASTFIEGITREIRIPEEIQIRNTNLSVVGNMLSLLPVAQSFQQPVRYTPDDVTYTIIEQTTMTGFLFNGEKTSVLNDSFRRGISVSVYTLNIEEVGVEFRLRTRYVNVDGIRIELNPGFVGTRIEVYRLEKVGKELELLTNTLINQEVLEVQVSGEVRELVIRMYKNYPDIVIPERKEYQFVLEKVKAITNNTSRSGTAISIPIEIPEGTEYIALVAEDYIPPDGNINYQVALLVDEKDNNPRLWYDIKPNNKMPAISLVNNELPPDRFISLSKGSISYILTRELMWKLNAVSGYRIPLYNILENINAQVGPDIKIENGVLKPALPGVEIEFDNITLYNGYGDWEVTVTRPSATTLVEKVMAEKKLNPETQWFYPIIVPEPIEIVIKPVADTNSFTINHEPIYYENLEVIDNEGNFIGAVINSVTPNGPNWDVTISETLQKEIVYTIKLTVKVRPNTKISTPTMKVFSGNNELIEGTDFLFSPNNNTIILKKGNTTKAENEPVFLSYLRTVTEETELRYFSTWIYLTKRTTIPIGPFTQIEYSRGNFHKINGVDYSLENEAVLEVGIHKIETTQPYPSAIGVFDSEDFNYLTGTYSDAYIDLTGIEHRAFDNPMRKVSVTDMEYNIVPDARAMYVIDKGMLLMNKQPSWISQALLETSSGAGAIGDYLMNRKFDKELQINKSYPEAYKIDIRYSTGLKKRYVQVKVDMERSGIISPRVTRLGIVPIPKT